MPALAGKSGLQRSHSAQPPQDRPGSALTPRGPRGPQGSSYLESYLLSPRPSPESTLYSTLLETSAFGKSTLKSPLLIVHSLQDI